jgi:hypothetical protein
METDRNNSIDKFMGKIIVKPKLDDFLTLPMTNLLIHNDLKIPQTGRHTSSGMPAFFSFILISISLSYLMSKIDEIRLKYFLTVFLYVP